MDKARRIELGDLKWKKRLKALKIKRVKPKDGILFRHQGKPCSCPMCSPAKVEEKPKYKKVKERY